MAWTAFANHSSIHFSLFFYLNKAIVSVFNSEGPPVPIPNTEVKLVCAHNTWLEAAREDRSMLTQGNEVIRPRFSFHSVKHCRTKTQKVIKRNKNARDLYFISRIFVFFIGRNLQTDFFLFCVF